MFRGLQKRVGDWRWESLKRQSVLLDLYSGIDMGETHLRRLLTSPDIAMGQERKDAVCSSPLWFRFEV
jgi:hypothetical protein